MIILDDFLRAFLSLLVIIDPVGNLMVFHILTQRYSGRQQALTIVVAIGVAGLLLLGFIAGGHRVLDWLGISEASFRVAAGLLLLPLAYNLVVRGELPETEHPANLDPFHLGVVPMAVPLLAGPGALASVVTFTNSVGQTTTIVAVAAVLLLCTIAFAISGPLFHWIGGAFVRLLTRLVGLLVFGIATEFVLSGLASALRPTPL